MARFNSQVEARGLGMSGESYAWLVLIVLADIVMVVLHPALAPAGSVAAVDARC